MTLGEQCRGDFPILTRVVNGRPLVYLDSGASSQKPRSVLDAMRRFYEQSNANVHRSIHTLGEEATEAYEAARDAVRSFVGARGREEIIFTRGTTEGVNIVAHAIGRTLQPALDADPVPAQRVHVLECRVGIGQPAAEARAAEALADDVAVLHRAHPSSSPRAAFFRYGGKRQALSADMSPPWPSAARATLSRRSPARRRGSTRSNVVA